MCHVDFHGVCVFILILIVPSALRPFWYILFLKISYNCFHVGAVETYLANIILEHIYMLYIYMYYNKYYVEQQILYWNFVGRYIAVSVNALLARA